MPGSVMVINFQLEGLDFIALNGGPVFHFTEAISLSVDCESQAEVDKLWEKLTEGGEESQCGWLKDRYGLSWQIVPREFIELMSDEDPVKVQRVTEAMFQMKKLDIAKARQAYEGALMASVSCIPFLYTTALWLSQGCCRETSYPVSFPYR